MNKPPEMVKPGSWITVGNRDCVVTSIYEEKSPFGFCTVVFKKEKPTTHDVEWTDNKWSFADRSDLGGYAKDSDPYVQQLKRGKYNKDKN